MTDIIWVVRDRDTGEVFSESGSYFEAVVEGLRMYGLRDELMATFQRMLEQNNLVVTVSGTWSEK